MEDERPPNRQPLPKPLTSASASGYCIAWLGGSCSERKFSPSSSWRELWSCSPPTLRLWPSCASRRASPTACRCFPEPACSARATLTAARGSSPCPIPPTIRAICSKQLLEACGRSTGLAQPMRRQESFFPSSSSAVQSQAIFLPRNRDQQRVVDAWERFPCLIEGKGLKG